MVGDPFGKEKEKIMAYAKKPMMKKTVAKKAFKPCAGCRSKAACTKMGKCLAKK